MRQKYSQRALRKWGQYLRAMSRIKPQQPSLNNTFVNHVIENGDDKLVVFDDLLSFRCKTNPNLSEPPTSQVIYRSIQNDVR